MHHPSRSPLCQDSSLWQCHEHSHENCQHNWETRALPQRISSFPLCCWFWIQWPNLPFWFTLANSRLRAAAFLFPEIKYWQVFWKKRADLSVSDPLWLADLAFWVDITDHLNTLNKRLQGQEQSVRQLYEKIKAFCVKLCLFESQLCTSPYCPKSNAHFQMPSSQLKWENMCLWSHLSLKNSVRGFQDISVIEKAIILVTASLFLIDAEHVEESLQLEMIEKQCDGSLKNQHQLLSLPDFFQSLEKEKPPLLRHHPKRMINLFTSTYICEQAFSLFTEQKEIENQKDRKISLRCPSHPNHQTYSRPASYP